VQLQSTYRGSEIGCDTTVEQTKAKRHSACDRQATRQQSGIMITILVTELSVLRQRQHSRARLESNSAAMVAAVTHRVGAGTK
jgi:hypothetical protein